MINKALVFWSSNEVNIKYGKWIKFLFHKLMFEYDIIYLFLQHTEQK